MALIIGAISYFRLLDTYELILLDLRFQARPIQKVDSRIVIIEIGNDTLTNLGCWPIPRDYHATLIEVLSNLGVKAIVFDLLFSEPQDSDELLTQAVGRANNVYFPYALDIEERKGGFWEAEEFAAPLLPDLKQAARGVGFANVLTDIDGKRRRIPLFINYRGSYLPQLALKVAYDYLDIRAEEIKVLPYKFVQLGEQMRIPIDHEAAALVNLAGGWGRVFPHYSFCDILISYAQEYSAGEKLPAQLAQLKDKFCFIGLTATGTADINPSALESVYPMVGLQANLFNSILTRNFLVRLGRWPNLAILYLLCLLNLLFAVKTRPPLSILCRMGLVFLFVGIGFLLFIFTGIWIDLFFPIVAYILVYLGLNLLRYMKELRRRELLEKELSIARNIQKSFLQDVPENLYRVNIAVEMETAHHVGGDLYDFVQFADRRVGLMVGDVSGKGVPAALFMAQVISQFRNLANVCATPSETLTRLNHQLSRDAKSGLFVTMAYLIFNPDQGEISLASAGHLPALVFSKAQPIERIEVSEGMPLGLIEEACFTETHLKLTAQELVLLYTDGLTEARDKKGREFKEEGIVRALKNASELTSQQALQALKGSLKAFVGGATQHDDITIMALKAN